MAEICAKKQFTQPQVLMSSKPLNWVYMVDQRPNSKYFSKDGGHQAFVVVNASGLEYRIIRMQDFKVAKTIKITTPRGGFTPNDCMMLEGNRLLCSTLEGLLAFFLEVKDPQQIEFKKLNKENSCRIARSKCKRMIAVSGRTKNLYLYEASSLKTISKIGKGSVCDLRMTSEHIFMKSSDRDRNKKGWFFVSLKATYLTKTLRGSELNPLTSNIHHLLYNY
jgi:hypothetical protein